jgi:hypothetical protein
MSKPTIAGKPYQVEVFSATGVHTEHFSDREAAESYACAMLSSWTNLTKSGNFEQYEHATVYKDWQPIKQI